MAGRNFLFRSRATQCPDRVLRAMAVPMEDHRSPVFPELTRACLNALKPVFKTATASPILFPFIGTGCWEAALTNCLNRETGIDLALRPVQPSMGGYVRPAGLRRGNFGDSLGEGAPVERYLSSSEFGQAATRSKPCWYARTKRRRAHQRRCRDTKAMDSVKHPALCFVDSVSALASIEFRMDDWASTSASAARKRLDAARRPRRTCVSQKALEAAKAATSRRCYFDYAGCGLERFRLFSLHSVDSHAVRPA